MRPQAFRKGQRGDIKKDNIQTIKGIQSLPPELLIKIFVLVLDPTRPAHLHLESRYHAILRIMGVCRWWYNVALHMHGEVWDNVPVFKNDEDGSKTAGFLSLGDPTRVRSISFHLSFDGRVVADRVVSASFAGYTWNLGIEYPASIIAGVLKLIDARKDRKTESPGCRWSMCQHKPKQHSPSTEFSLTGIKTLKIFVSKQYPQDDVLDLSAFDAPSLTSLTLYNLSAFRAFGAPAPFLTFLHIKSWKGSPESLAMWITDANFPSLDELIFDSCTFDFIWPPPLEDGPSYMMEHRNVKKLVVITFAHYDSIEVLKFLALPNLQNLRIVPRRFTGYYGELDAGRLVHFLRPSIPTLQTLYLNHPDVTSIGKLLFAISKYYPPSLHTVYLHDLGCFNGVDWTKRWIPWLRTLVVTTQLKPLFRHDPCPEAFGRFIRTYRGAEKLVVVSPSPPGLNDRVRLLGLKEEPRVLDKVLFVDSHGGYGSWDDFVLPGVL